MDGAFGCCFSKAVHTEGSSREAKPSFPWAPLVLIIIVTVGALAASNYFLANKDDWSWLENGSFLEDSNIATLYALGPAALVDLGLLIYIGYRGCTTRKSAPGGSSDNQNGQAAIAQAHIPRTASKATTDPAGPTAAASPNTAPTSFSSSSSSASISATISRSSSSSNTISLMIECPSRHSGARFGQQFTCDINITFSELLRSVKQSLSRRRIDPRDKDILEIAQDPSGELRDKKTGNITRTVINEDAYVPQDACFQFTNTKNVIVSVEGSSDQSLLTACLDLSQPLKIISKTDLPIQDRPSNHPKTSPLSLPPSTVSSSSSSSSSSPTTPSSAIAAVNPLVKPWSFQKRVSAPTISGHPGVASAAPFSFLVTIAGNKPLQDMTIAEIVKQIEDQSPERSCVCISSLDVFVRHNGATQQEVRDRTSSAAGIDQDESWSIVPQSLSSSSAHPSTKPSYSSSPSISPIKAATITQGSSSSPPTFKKQVQIDGSGKFEVTITVANTLKAMTIGDIIDQIKAQLPASVVMPSAYQFYTAQGSQVNHYSMDQSAEGLDGHANWEIVSPISIVNPDEDDWNQPVPW